MKKSELYSLLWEACNKLRGGVEPARYKDYVLVLLFFKYVSDRYKGQPFAEFTISTGASFEDLIAAKGKSDVGERVDKIIQKFLEDNRLQGSLPDVSFNNPDELGSGKELVDKVSGLIAVFQNPAIDFKNNRASGDDIIGDAYEYFMMKFAQESGKSKGQFYTPSEVSRIIARLIGIGNIRQMPTKKWTLYDPAAGSGSLLIRAADEAPVDEEHDVYNLALPSGEIEGVIGQDASILAEKQKETDAIFAQWRDSVKDILLGIESETNPKELIRMIAVMLLNAYGSARLLDNYDVYDCLLNYWNAKLQDDVYAIKASGYEVGREIEYEYAQKKAKDENGETISVDDTSKVKSFEGALIPREIIEAVYFADELAAINELMEQSTALEAELDEMREDESGDEGLLKDVLNDKGDSIPKANLNKRLKELDAKKTSAVMDAMMQLVALFDEGKTDEMETLIREVPELAEFDIRNKNGTFGKAKLKTALKVAADTAVVPEIYKDEYDALTAYATKSAEKDEADKAWKEARKALDDKVEAKYGDLTVDEIKHLLFDMKWMAKLEEDIRAEIEQVLNNLSSKVLLIAKRYEHTLGEIEERAEKSRAAVVAALERMGYKW